MRCKWSAGLFFMGLCLMSLFSVARANEPTVTVAKVSTEQVSQAIENKIDFYHIKMNQEQYEEIVDDVLTAQKRNSKSAISLQALLKKYHDTLGNFVSIKNRKSHVFLDVKPSVIVFYNSVFENREVTEKFVFQQENGGAFTLIDYTLWNGTVNLAYLEYLDWNDKGNAALYKLKNPVMALQSYYRSIAVYPNAEAYLGCAMCQIELENFEQALSDLDNALRLNQNMVGNVSFLRGEVYRRQKNYDGALAAYEAATAVEPQCIDAYYSKGLVYEEKKAFSLAIEAYENYVQKTLSSHKLNLAKIKDAQSRIAKLRQISEVVSVK